MNLLILIGFLSIYSLSFGYICNHVHPKPEEVITGVYLEGHDSHFIKRRDLNQPLRIKLFFDESVYKLSEEKFNLITNYTLPEAVNYWQNALRVRKAESVIRLNRRCHDNQVFLLKGEPHPFCKSACEERTMCGEVVVPEKHLNRCRVCNSLGHNCTTTGDKEGEGIPNSDFVFYISALETDRCKKGSTVAYAAHCQQESSLDRPIAGHANLCPSSISLKEQESKTLLSTVKHEILHALGFSVSLYAFFRDDKGRPLTDRTDNGKPILNEQLQARQWSEKTIKTFQRKDWKVKGMQFDKTVRMIVTPRVVREARAHFQCPDLEGAELEDQGHEGTSLTHWEKRMFENEAMTGTHTQNPVYSRITLALMEDTGWYRANYEMAQSLQWGRKLGCDFAMHSCKHWMDLQKAKNQSIHPYCDKVKRDPLETECTEDRNSVALCNLIEYPNPLPPHYLNFDSIPHIDKDKISYYGGSVSLADYCPYIQEFTWKNGEVVIRGSHCNFPENNPVSHRNFALEKYTSSSKCFNHEQEWTESTCTQQRQWQHWGSGCYTFKCYNGRLHIEVANHTYTCFHAGQVITISVLKDKWLHRGAIICPPCFELCQNVDTPCKPDTRHINATYYQDNLKCLSNSCRMGPSSLVAFFIIYLLLS